MDRSAAASTAWSGTVAMALFNARTTRWRGGGRELAAGMGTEAAEEGGRRAGDAGRGASHEATRARRRAKGTWTGRWAAWSARACMASGCARYDRRRRVAARIIRRGAAAKELLCGPCAQAAGVGVRIGGQSRRFSPCRRPSALAQKIAPRIARPPSPIPPRRAQQLCRQNHPPPLPHRL
ncbi:hypothetical protein FGB62_116g026 [Gracilaria domingensis]|nr:hypothetical protein FGB62_116g026 [Gracilaria domingensis]